jgi:DNA-binding LacI/PurR family transcriptional regulator
MQLLIERVENESEDVTAKSRHVLLKPELLIRESTARLTSNGSRKRARA